MMSRSDRGPDAGFTLFDVLISLAILAAILAIATTALRPPSPALLLERQLATLKNDAALARDRAVRLDRPVALPVPGCQTDEGSEALFFPDGTARATGPICLTQGGLSRRLLIEPITARIAETGP
ncbi:hypothetical protein ACOXXX_08745 [Thalassococcus sp. BH17M4-6]|uniref:hypothetical protein n=1 Tax=Thalassococcus sp. BH17M4-6 TaxID=3413148 RepID=UPI003BCADB89